MIAAGVDLFVIRGNTVSAEHVSTDDREPLHLKKFIYELDVPVIVGGAATYQAALHLMRTGAAGVLVGEALHAGGRDNISVVVVDAVSVAARPGVHMRADDDIDDDTRPRAAAAGGMR